MVCSILSFIHLEKVAGIFGKKFYFPFISRKRNLHIPDKKSNFSLFSLKKKERFFLKLPKKESFLLWLQALTHLSLLEDLVGLCMMKALF